MLRQYSGGGARQHVGGTIPPQVTFGAKLSIQTPKRTAADICSGSASKEIKNMTNMCSGIPMQYWDEKKGGPTTGPYSSCKTCTTSWYCVLCKRWMCVSQRGGGKKQLKLYSHTMKGKKLHFIKSCYHGCHQAVWEGEFDFNGSSSNG